MTTDLSEFLLFRVSQFTALIFLSHLHFHLHLPCLSVYTHSFPISHIIGRVIHLYDSPPPAPHRILICIAFYLGSLGSGFSKDLLPGPYLCDSVQLPEFFRILLETETILECLRSSGFHSVEYSLWNSCGAWARLTLEVGKLGCTVIFSS